MLQFDANANIDASVNEALGAWDYIRDNGLDGMTFILAWGTAVCGRELAESLTGFLRINECGIKSDTPTGCIQYFS